MNFVVLFILNASSVCERCVTVAIKKKQSLFGNKSSTFFQKTVFTVEKTSIGF